MSCPFEIDVVRWVTGDTRLNELERVEQHVAGCAGCRAKADALRAVLSRISQSPAPGTSGESSPKVFVESVMEKISRDRIARRRSPAVRRFALAAGFVLPIALFGGWTAYRMNRVGTARGGAVGGAVAGEGPAGDRAAASPVGCNLFVLRDGRTLTARDTPLRPTDQLVVKYENPGPVPAHALIAGLDASGRVQKLYPSDNGDLREPAVELAARSAGSVGDHPASIGGLQHGPVRVVAVVFDEPRGADAALASLRGRSVAEPVAGLFPHATVREWLLSWESTGQ